MLGMGFNLYHKALFFRELAAMIEAGMPILSCVEALKNSPNLAVRHIIVTISPHLMKGNSISSALAQFPQYFDQVTLEMIKSGEQSGSLDKRLNNIANYMEKNYKLQQKSISRMIYPILILHAGFLIPPIFLLITEGILSYVKAAIFPLLSLYSLVLIGYIVYKGMGMPLKTTIDSILINLPFIGSFFKAQATYRFTLVLSDMLSAGVSNSLAVTASARACGNAYAEQSFRQIVPHLEKGTSLTECLRATTIIPEMALQMIYTGEQSGSLPHMVGKASDLLGFQVEETTERVMTMLPVLFYFLVALYVGYIIISTATRIYAPLFELNK